MSEPSQRSEAGGIEDSFSVHVAASSTSTRSGTSMCHLFFFNITKTDNRERGILAPDSNAQTAEPGPSRPVTRSFSAWVRSREQEQEQERGSRYSQTKDPATDDTILIGLATDVEKFTSSSSSSSHGHKRGRSLEDMLKEKPAQEKDKMSRELDDIEENETRSAKRRRLPMRSHGQPRGKGPDGNGKMASG